MVVVLITFHLLSLRTFAGECMKHLLIQHDQGYRFHISYTPGKRIKNKKLIKNINNY
jgi:hypothetical protein